MFSDFKAAHWITFEVQLCFFYVPTWSASCLPVVPTIDVSQQQHATPRVQTTVPDHSQVQAVVRQKSYLQISQYRKWSQDILNFLILVLH